MVRCNTIQKDVIQVNGLTKTRRSCSRIRWFFPELCFTSKWWNTSSSLYQTSSGHPYYLCIWFDMPRKVQLRNPCSWWFPTNLSTVPQQSMSSW
jgi:hypothetical protein